MKRNDGKKILLQGYEVGFILNELHKVPAFIIDEVFHDGRSSLLIAGRSGNVDFSYEFKSENAVNWLREQDWILDFDECEKKKPQELIGVYNQLIGEYNAKAKDYNSKDSRYREEHFRDMEIMSDELNKLGHKIDSLSFMIYFLQHDREWP